MDMSNEHSDALTSEPIAIIGMSSKFAGDATNNESLWQMLIEGRHAWKPFPSSRFRSEGIYHPNSERLNSTHVKGAHFLQEDVGLFDAAFFGHSSEAAASLDPQYRLQLESVYEALESGENIAFFKPIRPQELIANNSLSFLSTAGLPIPKIAGSKTSVFTGVFVHDYRDALLRDADNLPRLMATGTGVPMMSNRISHFFDLRGASMTIETACSSTLVAMHQGIQSLRTGEADMSIIGGANLTLNPDMFKALSSGGFLSGDGKCYAFDSRASGYGRGEGVATVIIKRLKDALTAGDPIRAVIRGSALNQDGKTETITTPSLQAQEELIRACYLNAGLSPEDTQYVEAHGTGTQAGDTVEARAIATVFACRDEPLLVGSVKTNLGHTEAASGLASIIKTVLALEKGIIPPSINFEKPNPKIPLQDWNLKLVRKLEKWPAAKIRRASVNNFGYGGANAHIVMEESRLWLPAPESEDSHANTRSNRHPEDHPLVSSADQNHADENTNGYQPISSSDVKILILSGRDEQACQRMISNLADFLEQVKATESNAEEYLQSLAYTLCERRTIFPWAAAYPVPVTPSFEDVVQTLRSPKFRPSRSSRQPRIGMVFTGQGAQWYAMGRELIESYPVYRASLEEAEKYLKQLGADWSLMEELSRDAGTTRINSVALSTPICVVVQISLVRLLRSWGVVPVAVTSHSSGEMAAAFAADALSYKQAMAFSYYRALLATDKSLGGPVEGAMIAIDTQAYLARLRSGGKAVVACINSPSSITVAGDLSAVMELESLAKEDGVFARRLKVDTAWHSHHMAGIATLYAEALEAMQSEESVYASEASMSVAFSSPVTGNRITSAGMIASPKHWVNSLVQPVRFVEAFTDMVSHGLNNSPSNVDIIVEVGPHTALGGPIQQILELPEFKELDIPYYGCLVRNNNAQETMLALASSLIQQGYPVDMEAVNFPNGKHHSIRVLPNLPSYPWNHHNKHWVEPRFNKALRERSQPPHDLLGSLVDGVNPASPSWRHTLDVSSSPWTRDHVIQSNILYPAAGYICLAVEALKQLTAMDQATHAQEVSGYELRDVEFLQALIIPDDSDGIEIQTQVRPVSEKDVGLQGWKHFEIWSVTSDNRWTHHAKGLITVEPHESETVRPTRSKPDLSFRSYAKRIVPADLFANLRALGITHGPMFQNFKSIVQSGSDARSLVTMAVADISVSNDLPRHHVLNPATLDAVFTAPYSAVKGAVAYESTPKVPRSVQHLWLSSNITNVPGHLLDVRSQLVRQDKQGMEAKISVSNEGDGNMVLEMEGCSYQSLGNNLSSQQNQPWKTKLCSQVEWSLDISLSSPATISSIREQLNFPTDPLEEDLSRDLSRVCIHFMKETLAVLDPNDLNRVSSDLAKHYVWMKHAVQQAAPNRHDVDSSKPLDVDQMTTSQGLGKIICQIGGRLPDIMLGKVSPLELLVQDNMLSSFNEQDPGTQRAGAQLAGLLRYIAHKNPRIRILEIGAGAGAMTRYALEALGTDKSGGPHAYSYHYTDISTTFFEAAQANFSSGTDLLSFGVLDIQHDPEMQGFAHGTYDVVIASRCLNSTKSISHVLGNVRNLLKPGGRLLLTEELQHGIGTQFVNGLLPGWHSEEHIGGEACNKTVPSMPVLHGHLQDAGFSGVDLDLYDLESFEMSTWMTVMSTSPEPIFPNQYVDPGEMVIITGKKSGSPPPNWIQELHKSLYSHAETDKPLVVRDLESLSAAATWYADKICLFVGEIEEPILYNLDRTALEGIRAMSTNCQGLIWVTRGGTVDCERPELGLVAGFVRSLRTEYPGRKFLTLDLDPKGPLWSDSGLTAITRILESNFRGPEHSTIEIRGPRDFEYAERDGVILVPRFYHDEVKDQMISSSLLGHDATPATVQPFYQADRPLCLDLESLAFSDDVHAITFSNCLEPGLVEIEPKAYGTSLHQTHNRIISRECAGIITRVGSEALQQGYSVGDRVFCILSQVQSSLPSRAIVEWFSTMAIPAQLSFQDAASMPVAFLTAYYSLVEIGQLKNGQSVLIHDAEKDVGQAAIMISRHVKAEVFVAVSGPRARELITHKYGIPMDHVLDIENSSFGPAILTATNSLGVDIVLNTLQGPLLQQSFNLVAPLGSFIDISGHDTEQNSNLEMRPFARHVSFSAVDISTMLKHRGPVVHRCLGEVVRLLETKSISPIDPLSVFSLANMAEAFESIKTGHHLGKTVLSVEPDAMVSVLPRKAAAYLSPDSSYLIVGGNGGLGRSVAHWMVSRGAKSLIIMSRNASKSEKAGTLAQELREAGCPRVLLVSGDVAREDDVSEAIQTCAEEGLPPIRGLIHAAFVLRDSFVEKMTLDDYRTTIDSKVRGVWNLHNQFNLPGDLDFFVLFSSINGILGYPSQAAYSAAGAYEDALAHYRVKQCGLPAVSIDLSVVDSIGYVAEATSAEILRKSLVKAGRLVINEDQVLAALELAILSPYNPQFILGGINSGQGPHWDDVGDLGRDMRFLALKYRQPSSSGEEQQGQKSGDTLASKMAACASHDEAIRVVESALAAMLADMFLIPVEEIDLQESPSQHGVDSLMAVEVRNMLFNQAGAELSIFSILQSPSLTKLAADVMSGSKHVHFSAA
ncbi:hypothetical protein FSARC_9423 [Fusarium sarcochroum]|uniref:Polyketide synthase n=1 Tax=Fusarium sarcochroum TaxID=1208366 RepID=A0A8H4TQZ6_9HYPO|nr:hypothetical protein FSARC_9423 [Fusarium sarcochroum]